MSVRMELVALAVSAGGAVMVYLPCELRARTSQECSERATTAVGLLGGGGTAAALHRAGLFEPVPESRQEAPVVAPRELVVSEPDVVPFDASLELQPLDERPIEGR